MKKTLLLNIIVVALFFLFDALLSLCGEWADTYNLGAEMVLGMITPVLFILFVFAALCSIFYSCYKCFSKKDIKHLVPILAFVIGVIVYVVISNSGNVWVKVINYYLNI